MELEPFPHLILDGWAAPELCRAALAEWPEPTWPHWLRYDGDRGTKYATKDASRLPPACAELVRSLLSLPIERLTGIAGTFPDVHLHGAGMHMIPPGGELPLHLDGDHNPGTGHERALSGVLFLNEAWRPEWGGALQLWGTEGNEGNEDNPSFPSLPSVEIAPAPGRLVLFECGDRSWHSVRTVAPDAEQSRCTLSVFWWRRPSGGPRKRGRAEFCSAKKG